MVHFSPGIKTGTDSFAEQRYDEVVYETQEIMNKTGRTDCSLSNKKCEDKCKTDPIWLTYNRAYKTHYARYMKGKMTQDELEIWGRKAIDLRERAISGELSYDEYYEQIRK